MNYELQKTQESVNSLVQYKEQSSIIGKWIKNEDEYAIALTYSEKKIGEFDRQDMTQLVELMAQWRLFLGVTSDSTEQELIAICQFVYDNFKRYTLSDVRLAMNWAISGKVEVGFVTQKNISSFYVSKALNAYEEEKRRIYNQLMYAREKELRKANDIKIESTPEEEANSFKTHILGMYQSFTNGTFFLDFGDIVYNWLKKTNQVTKDKAIIDEAIRYGINKYQEERRSEKTNIASSVESNDKDFRQKKLARQFIVMHYFTNTNLQGIIQSIKPEQFIKTNNKI